MLSAQVRLGPQQAAAAASGQQMLLRLVLQVRREHALASWNLLDSMEHC